MSEETFVEWLNTKIKEKGWSMRELARRMNVSHTTVVDVVSGKREPTFDFSVAIARAFDLPPETVLMAADLLPEIPPPGQDPTFTEIMNVVKNMNSDERIELLEYALFKFRKRK